MNALKAGNAMDDLIIQKLLIQPSLPRLPEIFVSITVPNEFQRMGQFNIGITAGIETTACSAPWIEGMNRMDLILTISEHSKRVLSQTQYQIKNDMGVAQRPLRLEKPIEVLPNCVHTDVFKKLKLDELDAGIVRLMADVKENFCFLFVGHWLQGQLGADRKDVGMLVKVFLETFKRVPAESRPALILKTSGATFSVMDREDVLRKIQEIAASVSGQSLPSVYLLHGDLTEQEMSSLYNHPKVKAMVSFTKGEGFGRPFLEWTMTGKPLIVSGWSGHLDFLTPTDAILLGGKLEPVHPSAVWEGVIERDTKWFQVDYQKAAAILHTVWKNYKQFEHRGDALAKRNAEKYSFDSIKQYTGDILNRWIPAFNIPEQVELKLPQLKKIKPSAEVKSATLAAPKGAESVPQTAQVAQEVTRDALNQFAEVK
jgi:glycosyltransferase involved in cell wall biosynthesis